MSNAGGPSLDLGFVQLGNLLEAERTILPPRQTASAFAGALQAGGTFISSWVLVESGAWSQVLEDFAVLLPLSQRRFRARRAVAGPSAPRALPAGSKGRADGLHCERESVQGSVSRETWSARECGGARLLCDSREMLLAELWGACPWEQEVLDWSHGLCGSVVGAVHGSRAHQHGPGPAPVG